MRLVHRLLEGEAGVTDLSRTLRAMEVNPLYKASMWEYWADDIHCVHLMSLMVKRGAPDGVGTSFMRELTSLADRENLFITLELGSRDYGKNTEYKTTTSSSRLRRWYARLGFKKNSSKGLFQLRGTMHRPPNGRYPWIK